MIKRTVIFRADGGPNIGMGHFTRSLALAEMLNKQFACVFATRKPSKYQIAEIEKACHNKIELPDDDSHFEKFLAYLDGDEIVVLDNYYFTTEFQKEIKSKVCKLVCIDDLYDKHFVADVIINHAPCINPFSYSREPHTKLLLGFEYALLRKELLPSFRAKTNQKYSCLLIMGGADPLGLTKKILHSLEKLKLTKPIVVVSPKDPNCENIVWQSNLSAFEIAQLMEAAEFGILPASTVSIEACAKRLPFVCGYFVDNQINIYSGIKEKKMAICVGDYNSISETVLNEAIFNLMMSETKASIIKNQMRLIDDKIGERFIKIFKKL